MVKVAVTGPESTGKSTLSQALAEHYNVSWAREFARDFLRGRSGKYNLSDLDEIAQGQQKNIDALRNEEIVIADTEMTVMKVWSEFKYGESSQVINDLWESQHFNIYLLCAPDIPYEKDPLREHEAFREELFEIYHNILRQMNVHFVILKGNIESRINQAITEIDQLIGQNISDKH